MGKYGDDDDIDIEWAGMAADDGWWGLLDGGLGARFGWAAAAAALAIAAEEDEEAGGGERERDGCVCSICVGSDGPLLL